MILDLQINQVFKNGQTNGFIVNWEEISEKKAAENAAAQAQSMVELSPINTLLADKEGKMLLMNANSKKTLEALSSFLPAPVDQLVGNSIDWFHKNPEVQRKIIGDPKNLPYTALIDFANEKLDLLVSPVYDNDGGYIGPMVTWEVVTQKLETELGMQRTQQMVDKSPINTVMARPDGVMTYRNEKSG